MRISGCVIAKNEEKNIVKCLSSLKKISDEVILVDTGSTDNTIDIAKEMGAIVFEQPWEDDFSKPKNLAIEKAKGDWIVFLDADEYFDENSEIKFREIIEKNDKNKNIEGIQSELVNVDVIKKNIISNIKTVRIFRNKNKIRFINKIHEEIRFAGRTLACINLSEDIKIIHTGYNELNRKEKAKRNLEMMLNEPGKGHNTYYLASSCYLINEFEDALKYCMISLSNEEIMGRDYLAYKIYVLIITLLMILEPQNNNKIEKYIAEASDKYGNHPEIVGVEGNYLFSKKLYSAALGKYLLSLEYQELYGKTFKPNDFPALICEICFCIANIYYKMNNDDQAMEYYVKSLKANKRYELSFSGMIRLCKDFPEVVIISLINEIYNIEVEDELRFIVEHINQIENPKVTLYYVIRWNNNFGHEDDTLIYAFIAQKKYLKALEIARIFLKKQKDAFGTVTSGIIILGRAYEELDSIKNELEQYNINLLEVLKNGRLNESNVNAYVENLAFLVKYIDEKEVRDYIDKGFELGTEAKSKIADTLIENEQFEYALKFYKDIYENFKGHHDRASLLMRIGYCLYKMKNYNSSLDYFEKAISEEYLDNDLKEYLDWICDLTTDSKTVQRAKQVAEKYSKILAETTVSPNIEFV